MSPIRSGSTWCGWLAPRESTHTCLAGQPQGHGLASEGLPRLGGHGRTYVVPEDVKDVAPMVLPHRVTLRGANQTDATQFV